MASMWAVLQGRYSSPSVVNPYGGLQHPRITSRCVHIRSAITSLPLKDLHQFFPHLLSNIFGFDRSGGWGLSTFSKKLHSDFTLVYRFLAPGGDLFQLISKLEGEDFLYEFPTSCLPRPTQQALTEGVIPPFYTNKVQLSFSVDNTPTHVLLSAFEYYFFHFAYFLVFSQTSQTSSPVQQPYSLFGITPIIDVLYTHLLDAYLDFFLPFQGTVPPAIASSPRQGSPPQQWTPPGSNLSGFPRLSSHTASDKAWGDLGGTPSPTLGLLRTNGVAMSPFRGAVQPGMEAAQTETFLQILVEFWLNQNTYNGGEGDLLAQAQNQFTPNEEHLLLLRRLIKQVHNFTNGHSYSQTGNFLSPLVTVTDVLRSSIIPLFFQKRLYYFLRYSFRHSPLDTNFRYILELWLTFVQPWRYLDPTKASAENKESLGLLPRKWKSFVLENYPFYSNLLMMFFGRCFQLDVTSDPGVTLLYRVAKVFSQPGLMSFIEYGESLLLNPDAMATSSPLSPIKSSPVTAACSVKAVFIDLDGPMFQYRPVFNQETNKAIQSLLEKVREAKGTLQPQRHAPQQLSPPSPLPVTPTAVVPPSTTVKKSWLGSIWDSLLPDQSSNPLYLTPATTRTDPKKFLSLLEATETYLATMFKLAPPKAYQPPSPEASPVLGKALPLLDTPTLLQDHTHLATPPKSLLPEYIEGTSHLTPRGKMQLIHGLRKCSNLDVRYRGDPELQPIRSFENTTLVRALYGISCQLNERFSPQLAVIGSSNNIFCKLLRQLLAPPPPPLVHTIQGTTEIGVPSTPIGGVGQAIILPSTTEVIPQIPRISLRVFGSYYTLVYLAFALFLIWVLSVPFWFVLLVVVFYVFLFCLFSYLGSRKERKTK